MSTPIEQNTIDLQALMRKVNNLPEAGTPAQEKTVEITENGTVEVTPDEGYVLSKVTANVNVAGMPPEDLNDVLAEQEALIAELQETLRGKAVGGGADTRFADLVMGTITTVDDSTITEFRPYAFHTSTNLVTVKLPSVTKSASSVFRDCSNLQSVDLPELAGTIGGSIFANCSNLTSVNVPKITSVNTYAFQNCSALTRLELGNVSTIGAGAFKGTSLDTLTIRKTGTTNTNLSGTTAFDDTPIANGTGYIYVPNALIDKFKAATNWSTYATQIRAIEDYPEICGGEV